MEAPSGDSTQVEQPEDVLAGLGAGRIIVREPSRPSSLCSTSSLGCHTSSCELSSSPVSPARATTASDEARRASFSLLQLPNSFLQNVLLLAGRDGGGLVSSCVFMRGLFHRLLATPPLAVRWMVELFGASGAPDAMARIPLERYLQRPSRSDEAGCSLPTVIAAPAHHAAAVKRIHMLGLLVVSGSLPHFSSDSAATLLRDACLVESPQAIQMVVRCAPPLCPAQAQPALLAATERGAAACVHELLRLTAVDPTAEGSLALRLASRAGSAACVEALLAAGAALERQHVAGFSPLDGLEGGVHSCLAEVGHSAEALAHAAAAAAAAGHAHVVGLLLRATRHPAAVASLAAVAVARGSSCSIGSVGSVEGAAGTGGGGGGAAAAAGTGPEAVASLSAAAAASGFSDEEALPAIRMLLAAGAEPSAFNGAMLLAACSRPPARTHRQGHDGALHARASCSRTSCSNPVACASHAHSMPSASNGRPGACAADLVRELVAAGADPRAEDSMPLVSACRVGADVEVVRVLLAAGADASAQDGAALRYACKHGVEEAVVALLAAPPGCHSLFGLATALAEAVAAGHRGVADALLGGCAAHGTAAQLVKDLALIQVAQAGCLEAVQLLLLMDADAAACGSKALAAAAEAGHDAVVEALLTAGADACARDNAPLIGAARWGRTAVVRRLLAAGADPCARDSWALWAASEAGHMETVAVLMAAGADPAVPMDEEAAGFDVASLIKEMECDG